MCVRMCMCVRLCACYVIHTIWHLCELMSASLQTAVQWSEHAFLLQHKSAVALSMKNSRNVDNNNNKTNNGKFTNTNILRKYEAFQQTFVDL